MSQSRKNKQIQGQGVGGGINVIGTGISIQGYREYRTDSEIEVDQAFVDAAREVEKAAGEVGDAAHEIRGTAQEIRRFFRLLLRLLAISSRQNSHL
jgi:hypothetical protein